ncbi:hypothetical protein HY78_09670 [Rhizorhabdus wittichii DC-6]|nr:hypothetical protein HY78_09670 [Rhizorhabdus wittichii DC-6]
MEAIDHWAALETAPWRGVAMEGIDRRLRALVAESPSIFLFHAEGGRIGFESKPGADPIHLQRAGLYRAFIERALRDFDVPARGSFAIGVHDRSHSRYDVPVFEYQKQRGASTMLLPDVDLLAMDFLGGADFVDPVSFADKRDEAIFVGSTTGGIITADTVRTLGHARLRAAMYFKDKPGICFELPAIVQCDSPETEAMVAALGLGDRRREWAEQLSCKYLLSIDGNGANCSRVALALHSNGVLVKYNSPWQLFYFHGLEAWRHYLPVRQDADVVAIVAQARDAVERDAAISMEAGRFARDHLSEAACGRYVAAVMRHYFAWFGSA